MWARGKKKYEEWREPEAAILILSFSVLFFHVRARGYILFTRLGLQIPSEQWGGDDKNRKVLGTLPRPPPFPLTLQPHFVPRYLLNTYENMSYGV